LGDESLPSCNETALVYREASGAGESKGELQGSVESSDLSAGKDESGKAARAAERRVAL
jgi:hypothetical protein